MRLKFFSSLDLSPEELKKEYRKLSKKHHPDIGGDEETFKAVVKEYQSLLMRAAMSGQSLLDIAQEPATILANALAEALREAFTNIDIEILVGINSLHVTLRNKFNVKNMLMIESIAKDIASDGKIAIEFRIARGNALLTYYTVGMATFINHKPDQKLPTTWSEESTGRRYDVSKGTYYRMVRDKKENHVYIMRNNKEFDLEKLVKGR